MKPHWIMPDRRGRVAALILVPLLLVAASLPFHIGLEGMASIPSTAPALLAAGAVYLVAHMLRALRLALLAAVSLHLHLRTVAMLHFYTAPASFIAPFKVGELYRWQQLAWLSRDPVGALVLLITERMLDAVVLLMMLVVGLLAGQTLPPQTTPLMLLLCAATATGLFLTLLAPGGLEATQTYIVRHHSAPIAMRLLRVTDASRSMTSAAQGVLQRNGVLLLMLSVLIWSMEVAVFLILSAKLEPAVRPVLAAVPAIIVFTDSVGAMPGITRQYVWLGLTCLMLLWPFATILYLRRASLPRRQGRLEVPRLSVRVPRRIHLRSGARLP